MNTKEFYYKIPEMYRGKLIELPKSPELKLYENYNKELNVPRDACYLILTQIGILDPTISYYNKDGYPTTTQDYGNHIFTDALEKRLELLLERVDAVPERLAPLSN